jgi:hypothetical protein
MGAGRKKISSLDKSLELVLRSKNRQIMLSQLHLEKDLDGFFQGKDVVQVITPTREMFGAVLSPVNDSTSNFYLTPVVERPKLKVGDSLLLLFQSQRQSTLSQASLQAVVGNRLKITSVDPRLNIRYKTRMRVLWDVVSDEGVQRLNQREITLAREESEVNDASNGEEYTSRVRDFAHEQDRREVPRSEFLFSSSLAPGLMTDLSLGGMCIMTKSPERVQKLRENAFILVDCCVPHLDCDYRIQLIAVARHIRDWGLASSIHCMFVERLRVDQLFV